MITLSIPQQIAYLREMSETVDTYIAKEIYKQDFNERDFSEKDILSQCYGIISDELRDYGIESIAPEYFDDFYLTNYIYYLAKFIKDLPTHIDDIDSLQSIIDNSTTSSILQDLIDAFAKEDCLKELIDAVSVNDKLFEYCNSIIDTKSSGNPVAYDPHVSRQMKYLNKIKTLRELASKYTNLIINKLELRVDNTIVSKLLKDYDTDKITSDNLPIYSLVDSDECPEELNEFKEKKMLEHHLRSPHHIEYYLDPHKNPRPLLTVEALVLLVAHHVEIGTTSDEFVDAVGNMVNKAETILLESQKELIDSMAGVIVLHLTNHGAE